MRKLIGVLAAALLWAAPAWAALDTWNPADKAASITLSNGNLTATASSTTQSNVRSVLSHSSGKWYIEHTASGTVSTNWNVGIATSAASLTTLPGWTNNTTVAIFSSGQVYTNSGTFLGQGATWVTGNVIGIAWDLDNNKVWFRIGAGGWNNDVIGNQNPATNTGGIALTGYLGGASFSLFGPDTTANAVITNFGGSAFGNAAPAGFSAWSSVSAATRTYCPRPVPRPLFYNRVC